MLALIILFASATFSLQGLQQLVSLSNATISPDGARIAFVASRVDFNRNRYDDTLEIYDRRSKELRSASADHTSVGNLAWSPDGSQLAAVIDDANGVSQIFLLNPISGTKVETTRGGSSVEQIAWDPRGMSIAFTRQDEVARKSGAAAYDDGFRIDDNAYLAEEEARPFHIWLVDRRGQERRLTQGPLSAIDSPLSWSPDGRFILYECAPAVRGLHDLAYATRLNVATGESTYATPHRSYEDQALYSPNGSHIAYLHMRASDPVNQDDVWLQDSTGGNDRDISLALDRQASTLAWMPRGNALLEQVDDRTQEPLLLQRVDGSFRRLPMGTVAAAQIQSLGSVARDGTIAFIGDQKRRPDELYVLAPGSSVPQRLTSFNDPVAALRLGSVTRVAWRSADGLEEDGVLTYPPDYIRGRRYPLVLRIHGGPNESSNVAFSDFYQLAASHGYLVFAPNYRGSTDLGNAYLRAIFNDPNTGPGEDVMAGIAAVERMGIVDESRIAVSGWSYGGQLTSWLEGHYNIWRAAVAGAAVNDLVVDYSIADDIDADRLMFAQSSPYKGNALTLWRSQSPIAYYQNIHTPTLILCNVYDVRVPIVESYEMFHALNDNGVPVEFYAYPTGGHLPQGPVREADAYRRWLAWFDRYLK